MEKKAYICCFSKTLCIVFLFALRDAAHVVAAPTSMLIDPAFQHVADELPYPHDVSNPIPYVPDIVPSGYTYDVPSIPFDRETIGNNGHEIEITDFMSRSNTPIAIEGTNTTDSTEVETPDTDPIDFRVGGFSVLPKKPQNELQISCALRNSLCGK